jgi:clusterin-associated protein 1
LDDIEKSVKSSVENLKKQLKETLSAFENLQADESNLVSKIEKKKQEFERAEKRLKSLQGVRPAYMDEYERIEKELVGIYGNYMEKFRNLAYLEQQLDDYNREEQDKFVETEESLKRMQNRLREEELNLLRGENDASSNTLRPARPAGMLYLISSSFLFKLAASSRGRAYQGQGEGIVMSDEEDVCSIN